MDATQVTRIYAALEARGVAIWIDGGWSVDAVLGRQTRDHDDLDIAVEAADEDRMLASLRDLGFHKTDANPNTPWNFVVSDGADARIDVHVVTFTDNGDAHLDPASLKQAYPAGALRGRGVIGGVPVRCIAAEFMLAFKLGYPLRDRDRLDVRALCEMLGRPCPSSHAA